MLRADLDELALSRNTLIKVVWEDITDDTVGNPAEAHLSERTTYALFWDFIEDDNSNTPCIVLTYCEDKDVQNQAGWLCVPVDCVTEVEIIRRPKRERKKHEASTEGVKDANL